MRKSKTEPKPLEKPKRIEKDRFIEEWERIHSDIVTFEQWMKDHGWME